MRMEVELIDQKSPYHNHDLRMSDNNILMSHTNGKLSLSPLQSPPGL